MITLAIPTYNRAHRLGELLIDCQELLTSTELKLRIVVVDDGSQDSTKEIINLYKTKTPELISIHSEANLGYARSFIKCIRESKGDWIVVLEDDGRINTDGFVKITRELNRSRKNILVTNFRGVNGSWERFSPVETNNLTWSNFRHAPGIIYRRSYALENLSFLESLLEQNNLFASFYPQVILSLSALASESTSWYPAHICYQDVDEGTRLIIDDYYFSLESRVKQISELLAAIKLCNSSEHRLPTLLEVARDFSEQVLKQTLLSLNNGRKLDVQSYHQIALSLQSFFRARILSIIFWFCAR